MTGPTSSGSYWMDLLEVKINRAAAIPGGSTPTQQTISASSAGANNPGWRPKENTYDGDMETQWSNDGVLANAWIQYDLGSTKNVSRVDLALTYHYVHTYPIKIQVGDGTTFTDVFVGTTALIEYHQFETFDFPATSGRYVRVVMTGNNSNGNGWLDVTETKIFASGSVPVTPTQQAISASSAGANNPGWRPKENTYDGDMETQWSNDGVLANAWIQYDLGSTKSVSRVDLALTYHYVHTYPIKIQVGDGTTFTDVFVGTTALIGYHQFETFNFPAASGRYVRVVMTGNNSNGNGWLDVTDVKVFGVNP